MNQMIRKMINRRTWPLLVVLLAVGLFVGYKTLGINGEPPTKQERVLKNLRVFLSEGHFSPKDINDDFSQKIFVNYLKALDRDKAFFLKKDIDQLKAYETSIDEEINESKLSFFPAVSALYQKRMLEVAAEYQSWLSKPFDFSVSETVVLDGDQRAYPANEQERKKLWQQKLKYLTLERYHDLLENRERAKANKENNTTEIKSDAALEADARAAVLKVMNTLFDRLKNKFNDEERFNLYINTISAAMDPHTNFFPPVDKRYFDEQMSGRFYGIGAQLQDEDGNIKITSLVAGSPAWKSGELQVGDYIIKVAEGAGEPVDLTGFDLTDAVKTIRGSKGTEVRLTIKKKDGSVKVVALVRDEIIQDEGFARSLIVKDGINKYGYIFLNDFYNDFERADGAKSAVDVAKEINKLKQAGVSGMIMDLRFNGGGSLFDVIQIAGYFIPGGPIVQVKDRDNPPNVLRDTDRSVMWDGPLIVMVNEYSASASEIFAAAIQDYKRGVVVGSTSTYGKGTVQRQLNLDYQNQNNNDLGSIKLTLQKFYRVNGGSTQLKGVESDIVLPDMLEYAKGREKDEEDALPWDEIAKASYVIWKDPVDLNALKAKSEARIKVNPAFQIIAQNGAWLGKQNDLKSVDLQLSKYKAMQKEIKEKIKEIDEKSKISKPLDLLAHDADMKRLSTDEGKLERFNSWKKRLSEDIYLEETIHIMNDYLLQKANIAGANF